MKPVLAVALLSVLPVLAQTSGFEVALRLESGSEPIEFIVVDSAEKTPASN